MAVLKPPPARTFHAINHAATRVNKAAKRQDAVLGGYSGELYSNNDDLVLLKQPEHEDSLTDFVHKYLPVLFMSEKRNGGMAYVPERKIA
ncbi:hypothetical protein EJ04DRAFT_558850 [Polyplosphaeria fusca]|uniref:Uncharacterized protein n=1 Tax=Polyplosphaeria fusca TaxID=682080 RepID=A0A9P4RB89_9PLEO|nr:hypothetical protein EJ04DRAFT_558850 [Polyplosphaeria fusca]